MVLQYSQGTRKASCKESHSQPSENETRSQWDWISWTPDIKHGYLIHRREASPSPWLPTAKKLIWTDEAIEAFCYCRVAVSNCQELYFLEHTVSPILQTDASWSIVNHQVRVIRFFSKSLVGSRLNWSAREKECYGIYYGVKLFEDLLAIWGSMAKY